MILLVRKADSIRTLQEFLPEFRPVKQLASPFDEIFRFSSKKIVTKSIFMANSFKESSKNVENAI